MIPSAPDPSTPACEQPAPTPATTAADAVTPGAKRQALLAEQAHLHRVHERVEVLRTRAAARVASVASERFGSTFQAQFERDVTAHHHATRAARYTFGDVEQLVFGRLDLDDGATLHVGRVSVIDADGDALLVDWRAPASAAFYQATPATPLGVARRRTLQTRGRMVHDLDDELLDAEAAARLGLEAVTGQGALLAALSQVRTGTMRDIVATIQGDQDRIIRAPASGVLLVTGGPGTGKTVVALHRVAFLLYRDRERFEGRGVLVVGPSDAFTEYTSRVLPALGEDRAVQRSLAALAPRGTQVTGWDELEVAAVKGDLAMVGACHRLLAASLPPIPPETRVSFAGTTVVVRARAIAEVRDAQLARVRPDRDGASYGARRHAAEQALRSLLWRAWQAQHRRAGGRPPRAREGTAFDEALDDAASVTMTLRCYWPERRADDVLRAAASGAVDVVQLAGDLLGDERAALLRAAWRAADGWTVDDVALLDELAALLGEAEPPATPERARDDVGLRLSTDQLRLVVERPDIEAPGYRDFAHVVVDEAQDLTPMQWRAVARRGPYASWTVVGDLAQRSRAAEPATWDEVTAALGRRDVRVEELTVNYRTPAEVVTLARAVLAAGGHDPAVVPTAVRAAGVLPLLLRTDDVVAACVTRVAELLAAREGTVGVLAVTADVAELTSALADVDEPGRVRVLDPRTAKGLELDDIVVVEPDAILASSPVGAHHLYVAVTRATRSVTLVARPDVEVPGSEACQERHVP